MEYKYVANIKELFAKLRVFNVITDVDTFSSIPGDYGEISLKFNNGKQEFLTEVLHETLLNLNYKLLERIVKNEYQVFNWQFVYPRYKRLQVIMSDTKVTMRFPKNQSAYEFFNWVDDICKNAVLVRGDAEEKYQELENLHNLLQEQVYIALYHKFFLLSNLYHASSYPFQETDHGIVEQIGFEDHHPGKILTIFVISFKVFIQHFSSGKQRKDSGCCSRQTSQLQLVQQVSN